jgi:hypothetical protein
MKRIVAIALSLVVGSLCSAQVRVAVKGKAFATVVTQSGASKAEIHAATELRDTLAKITGAPIALVSNPETLPKEAIIVGQGKFASQLLPQIKWAQIGDEEIQIHTVGTRLIVAGGWPRGTIYAVDRLLTKLGVRYWAPWATQIPRNPTLSIPAIQIQDHPAFEYRDPYWFHAFDADWAAHNGSNGINTRLDEAHGGKVECTDFVHTYYVLAPPEKLFKTHPEWFSLINGKRVDHDAQLCTTNPELREYLVQQVRDRLKQNPKVRMMSISQNDCFQPCQCDVCRAQSKREGSDAALVLDLVNFVAQRLEPEFPSVAFDTLAYQWSRKPPTSMRPRKNVIIWLCSIECSFSSSLDAEVNKSFADDVKAWSNLTGRLYVWDYATNFAGYLAPQPNYFTFGKTIRFLNTHGTVGLFEEGAYESTAGDMAELKAWVQAKLMWNPNLDDDALVREFLNGYYGVAGEPIYTYLKLMQEQAKPFHLSFANPMNATFLTYETMHDAELIWQFAEQQVSDNPTLLWRVKHSHLSVQFIWLSRWKEFQKASKEKGDHWLVNRSRKAYATEWLNFATGTGPVGWSPLTRISEGGATPKMFVDDLGADPPDPR